MILFKTYKNVMLKHLIVGLVLCLASFSAAAQRYVFPDEPGAFLGYVEENLKKTTQVKAIATAESFRSVWEGSGLNASQKASVIRICQKLALLKATIATEYADFFRLCAMLGWSVNLGAGP
ncbi:MAG: hypothetical protein HC913_15840 [Microscillaceae bacterium]|nr:hypothetical protein [Microscillaceae bacterium]